MVPTRTAATPQLQRASTRCGTRTGTGKQFKVGKTFCVVGAGFSGAVIARHLASRGHKVVVVDERSHLAGNCHTERDNQTGVMVHRYGPHIFHTANERVWSYVQQFGTFRPYVNRVKAIARGQVFSLPINLLTINALFKTTFGPAQARAFIASKADHTITQPRTFREQALSMVGPELYETFFEGYTRKQWGCDPDTLPASILKRLPLRFNYDDNYFNHPYQGMPQDGYTAIVSNILAEFSNTIDIRLGATFEDMPETFDHVFYTGPLDRYFGFKLGRLEYRTLDFERFVSPEPDYQGTAVMNYCDADVPYTRIAEHKHFAPWEQAQFEQTVCFREYSRAAQKADIPYYPIRLSGEQRLLRAYEDMARTSKGVSFLGRLGTYRYLDMDVTIHEALEACDQIDVALASHGAQALPAFFTPQP
ncbi:UDP-galactopyranose mutase [Acetobacter ghanensis]|uniref:UDP-galactopyranose mutase n=1 Tax=Acetobacter ghanensis TaxID=431306 RepID=A0A0U5EZT4_9PROT|nr:UDP-galactopyranose mutase [Acetobacter ghanensis]CEF53281.1 UDP-galactopyranose mutase [Acetobacter ghanensis]